MAFLSCYFFYRYNAVIFRVMKCHGPPSPKYALHYARCAAPDSLTLVTLSKPCSVTVRGFLQFEAS